MNTKMVGYDHNVGFHQRYRSGSHSTGDCRYGQLAVTCIEHTVLQADSIQDVFCDHRTVVQSHKTTAIGENSKSSVLHLQC